VARAGGGTGAVARAGGGTGSVARAGGGGTGPVIVGPSGAWAGAKGPGSGRAGGLGGLGEDAPKLGGTPPGLDWFPLPPGPPAWSPASRPSFPLTMAPSSPAVPNCHVLICRPNGDQL